MVIKVEFSADMFTIVRKKEESLSRYLTSNPNLRNEKRLNPTIPEPELLTLGVFLGNRGSESLLDIFACFINLITKYCYKY